MKKASRPFSEHFRHYILGTLAGAVTSLVLLLIFALIIWILQLPSELYGAIATITFGFSCIVGGFVSGLMKRRGGLSCGFWTGTVLFGLSALGMLIFGGLTFPAFVFRLLLAAAAGCFGGVWGVNKRKY